MKIDGLDPLVLGRIQQKGMGAEAPVIDEVEAEDMEPDSPVDRWRQSTADLPDMVEEITPEEVEEAVEEFNEVIQGFQKDLEFRLHEDSERWMVEVWDLEEDEIIKELPPERILDVVAQIQEMIGIMIDEKR